MSDWLPQANIEWRWRALKDEDTGLRFVISPFFGSLHTFSAAEGLPSWLGALGCTTGRRGGAEWESEAVDPPGNGGQGTGDLERLQWLNAIGGALRRWPLAVVVHQVEGQAARYAAAPAGPEALEDLAGALDSAWGYSREPECLPRALFRYRWLRQRGLYPKLFLGVHVPTDLLHAWVSLKGRVLGEEPDEMLCYEAAVCFFSRSASYATCGNHDHRS